MHEASDPRGPIIGKTWVDVVEAIGKPSSVTQVALDVAVLQWDNIATSNKPAFAATLPFGFSVAAGTPASCHAIATVLREGTVARFGFSGLGVVSSGEACAEIVRSIVQNPDDTSTRADLSWEYLLAIAPAAKSAVKP
jgi:hypothetical protein